MFVSKEEIIEAAKYNTQAEDARSIEFKLKRLGIEIPKEVYIVAKAAEAYNKMLVTRAVKLIPEEFLKGKNLGRFNGIFATNVTGRASINLEIRFYIDDEKVALLIDNATSKLYRSWTCKGPKIIAELDVLGITRSDGDFWVNEKDFNKINK